MEISTAAKSAALQNILTSTLNNSSERLTHREALDGLQLLVGDNYSFASDDDGLHSQAVDKTFTTALQIAERPQVRNAVSEGHHVYKMSIQIRMESSCVFK